jgi:hypothetical protein
MTTLTEIPVSKLAEQARTRELHPGRGLATAIAWVFVAIGWAAGALVTGIVFAAISVRYGYLRGRGLTDEQIEARVAAKQAAAQAAPAGR